MFLLYPMLEDVDIISGLVSILILALFDCNLDNVGETPTP
jgi:hypothetical protein